MRASQTDEARHAAALRWRNDAVCVGWIKSRGLTLTDVPGVFTYPHAWRMQSAGRIMPDGSGGAGGENRRAMGHIVDALCRCHHIIIGGQPRRNRAKAVLLCLCVHSSSVLLKPSRTAISRLDTGGFSLVPSIAI